MLALLANLGGSFCPQNPFWFQFYVPKSKKGEKKQGKKPKVKVQVNVRSVPKTKVQARPVVLRQAAQEPRRPHQGVLADVGGIVGGVFGAPAIGRAAGDWLGKITGWGDYHVSKNSLVPGANAAQCPQFMSSMHGVEIAHREFIGNVYANTDFTINKYAINPGQPGTFAWLSKVAENFDEYEMLGLVFEYRPASGMYNSATPSLGVVIMATQYDANEPDFQSKRVMESYEFCTSCVPCESMIHPVECDPRQKVLKAAYIRTGLLSANEDIKMFDLGNLSVATQGCPATGYTLGELWVSYHVRLRKPRIYPTCTTPMICYLNYPSNMTTDSLGFSNMSVTFNNFTFGSLDSQYFVITDGSTMLFPQKGYYCVCLHWASPNNVAGSQPGWVAGANVVKYTGGSSPGINLAWGQQIDVTTTGTQVTIMLMVKVKANSTTSANTLVISNPFTTWAVSSVRVSCVPLNYDACSGLGDGAFV